MPDDNLSETSSEDPVSKNVSLNIQTLGRVNFASAQNDVAIIRRLAIENPTKEPLTDVRITLRSSPPIIREKTWVLDRIAVDTEFEVNDVSTPLDIERLAGLNESEIGELEFRLEANGLETIVEKCRIELLARDEWGGVNDMAQILAAFVSPNDSVIAGILKAAARLLEAAGHDGSMNGYQEDDPRRAYLIAGAIWSAATGLGLTYAEPPKSFERDGQKVRGPARIADEGLTTCLDSSLFLAAAFEAAGLNPAVLFSQSHAWVGVWIRKTDFGHVTEPDVIAVRKAVQAREFVPIETTLLTKRPSVGFDQAVDEGRRRLSENRETEFVMGVDIARSRAARIRPLASHKLPDSHVVPTDDEVAPAALPRVPDFGLLPGEEMDESPSTPQGRIERWQKKLLDLSLRNRLLNFRDSKQTLRFRCPNVADLEDAMAASKKFQGLALKDDDPIGERTLSPEDAQRIEEEVVNDAFQRGQLGVPLTGREMNNRFLTLFRRAKSDMQEGGTNTLFLATGFLRWKKSEGDTRTFRAPILLIPVKLERRSAQSNFKLSHHEDDVRINSTLLEFLKRDFDLRVPVLEGELPRDESGIDVPLIFEIMRSAVREVEGFEVVEDLVLSTFSFAKYLMWKDLVDRADQLRENPLVRHLIDGPKETYGQQGMGPPIAPGEIDRRIMPQQLLTPLPADSSQLAAIIAASDGRDFVLIGPPGTGKSQTIANIIAQLLGEGKSVLFVAEKAAALDVVHRRLAASKLGDAVLELHSNKTDRRAVISQLGRGWDRASGTLAENWIEVTGELKFTRDKLNAYVDALHSKGTQGFSIFEAVGRVADGKTPFKVSFSSKDAHDETSYNRLISLAAELGRTFSVVGDGPSLAFIRSENWSYQWEAEILLAADDFRAALSDLKRTETALSRELGLRADAALSSERREKLRTLRVRVDIKSLDLTAVPEMDAEALLDLVEKFVAIFRKYSAARADSSGSYSIESVRRMPLNQIDADWHLAQTKIWPASWFSRKKIRNLLQSYATTGTVDPSIDIRALLVMRDSDIVMRKSPVLQIADIFSKQNVEKIVDTVRQAIDFRDAIGSLRADAEDPIRFGSAVAELASAPGRSIHTKLGAYMRAEGVAEEKGRAFVSKGGDIPDEISVHELDEGLALVAAERARLVDWARWIEQSNAAIAAGLESFVNALESGLVNGGAKDAFRRAYASWWLPLAMDASDQLRRFLHWDHEDLIETFRQLDDKAAELAPIEVMRRISHGLPAKDNVSRHSELGALRHQLGLQRPSMPIRTLLGSLPETFGKLAPCVLMSPLSVAQYLPAGQAAFDTVIFDEASQITTWDAIGVIARAHQTIIVGDPKQLPPTNFFGRADDGDEDLPEVERDMPSILDEVATAGVPIRRLDWHYRSRDEALIAFSNHFYYGGGLVTFPAPSTGTEALKFHHVKGTYARGRGRVNVDEAKAVVAMIKQRLTTWLAIPENERLTIGVITFNTEQQSHILDLLDKIRRADNRLEWFFADEREEPVIVKNLENIQGDERDVMLFSTTFGPDIAGKLTMNFGALNSAGGEKRLNVAITRARRELHVFASIRAEQINLAKTRAVGVRDLKAFLDYAERGSVALPARDEGSLGPAENVFEEAVADSFRAKGWEVRTQVGVSGYRVDLGIVHPDRAGSYLAGLECDGAQYHSSATARDRDKIRQSVLEGLGWTILRIWSTDWFRNSSAVVDRIQGQLKKILDDDRAIRAAQEAEEEAQEDKQRDFDLIPQEAEILALSPPEPDGKDIDEAGRLVESNEKPRLIASATSISATRSNTELGDEESGSNPPSVEPIPRIEKGSPVKTLPERSDITRDDASLNVNPSRFFDADYAHVLRRMITDLVNNYGPMPLHALAKRIAHEHRWKRTGRRIMGQVECNIDGLERHEEFGNVFLWAPGTHSDRVAFRGLKHRAIRDVSRAEISSVIDANAQQLASAEDPILALSRNLGIARLSRDARTYLSDCFIWREQRL